MATRRAGRPGTRERILRIALAEFSARGFAATTMDRLAHRARVNKALLYYYFGSKLALYRDLLRTAVQRLYTPLKAIAEGPGSAPEKLDRYIATLARQLDRYPELPPLILRELADQGRHLDSETLTLLVSIFPTLRQILNQGRAEGVFGDVDPLLTHFVLMGTSLFFTTNAPIRRRVRQLGLAQPPTSLEPFIEHLQAVARRSLREDHVDDASRS